jgi:hypothetical protein
MRFKYLILAISCLLTISVPSTSTIFELANYTIDTGAYETPSNAEVDSDFIGWAWNDTESTLRWTTSISVSNYPLDDSNVSKLSDTEYMAVHTKYPLLGIIAGIDTLLDPLTYPNLNSSDDLWENLSPVFVDKPYPGFVIISRNHPSFKFYGGAIDKFNYLYIVSSESDESMALLMSEIKVYPKEENNAVRLQAIQKRLAAGTRDNPVPIGTVVDLGDGWQIVVLDVIPSATKIVMGENPFNDPPEAGNQFFLAKVRAKYIGEGSDTFGGRFRLRVVGPSSIGYSTFENSPGVIPDPLPDSEVFSGGIIEGNIGWEVKSSDASSLVMYDSPISFGDNKDRIYMALY